MIIKLILDILFYNITPFKSYLILYNINKNNIFLVLIIALLLDIYSKMFFINTIIILILYYLSKFIHKEYLKNILVFIIYFNLMYFLNKNNINNYLFIFIQSLIFNSIFYYIGYKLEL